MSQTFCEISILKFVSPINLWSSQGEETCLYRVEYISSVMLWHLLVFLWLLSLPLVLFFSFVSYQFDTN